MSRQTGPSAKVPLWSGPRWGKVAAMQRAAKSPAGRPLKPSLPVMPHLGMSPNCAYLKFLTECKARPRTSASSQASRSRGSWVDCKTDRIRACKWQFCCMTRVFCDLQRHAKAGEIVCFSEVSKQLMRYETMRLALVGNGAIAGEVVRCVADNEFITILGALVLPHELDVSSKYPLVSNLEEMIAWQPDLVVECAGHSAVNDYAVPLLVAGIDLMIISIGALADQDLYAQIEEAASRSTAQVILPAGALTGMDGLVASRRAGLTRVFLTSRKPPLAWAGAPGVEGVALEDIDEETVIFSGNAARAALLFPKNANVAATTALAGIGFEETDVRLIADPAVERNTHILEFEGEAGFYKVEMAGLPSTDNPKTSMLTAYNIVRMIEQRVSALVI